MAGQHRFRTAAVFGGGGVAGIAWEVGVLAGLARAGVAVHRAGLFVGTSAGSVVGAQLACGLHIEALLHAQLHPPADSPEQFRPYSQAEADAQNRKLVAKVEGDLTAARQRIGDFARRSETPPRPLAAPSSRAAAPGRLARAPAAHGGRGCRHRRAPGVRCGQRRAAGRGRVRQLRRAGRLAAGADRRRLLYRWGIASMTNAEVAIDAERVLVLSPFGYAEGNPVSGHLGAEVAALQAAGCAVHVVAPSPAVAGSDGPERPRPRPPPGQRRGRACTRATPSPMRSGTGGGRRSRPEAATRSASIDRRPRARKFGDGPLQRGAIRQHPLAHGVHITSRGDQVGLLGQNLRLHQHGRWPAGSGAGGHAAFGVEAARHGLGGQVHGAARVAQRRRIDHRRIDLIGGQMAVQRIAHHRAHHGKYPGTNLGTAVQGLG